MWILLSQIFSHLVGKTARHGIPRLKTQEGTLRAVGSGDREIRKLVKELGVAPGKGNRNVRSSEVMGSLALGKKSHWRGSRGWATRSWLGEVELKVLALQTVCQCCTP